MRRSFTPLVETYGTVPYADVDVSALAGIAYVLMFGMMFGDAGHGALLVVLGFLLRTGRPACLPGSGKAGHSSSGRMAAIVFGLLYGDFFGPTGVVPVLWLAPLDEPITLMAVALGVGAALLAGAQIIGTINRWREGGWPLALSASSGIAGAALLAGLGLIALGAIGSLGWLIMAGALVIAGGVALAYIGFLATAGGGGGITQASVEVFDAVMRVGTNLVSFTRLAAFGLTHAALGMIVWDGTAALARSRASWWPLRSSSSSSGMWPLSASRHSWPGCRLCASSITSCSPGFSSARADRFAPGTCPPMEAVKSSPRIARQ